LDKLVVTQMEIDGRVLAPPSLKNAVLHIDDSGAWVVVMLPDFSSDISDRLRRNGYPESVNVRITTEAGAFDGMGAVVYEGPADEQILVHVVGRSNLEQACT